MRRAAAALDPKVDAHWGADGKPSVEIMAQVSGIPSLNRAMIDTVVPEFDREDAREAADL